MKEKELEDILLHDDREISDQENLKLSALLDASPEARSLLGQWREVRSLLKTLEDPASSETFVQNVMSRIPLDTEQTESWWKALFMPEWLIPAGGLATASIAWGLFLSTSQMGSTFEDEELLISLLKDDVSIGAQVMGDETLVGELFEFGDKQL